MLVSFRESLLDDSIADYDCRLSIATQEKLAVANRQSAISLLSKPANGPARKVHPNTLHLRVKVQRVTAHLSTVA
jgi:hypothetical protein